MTEQVLIIGYGSIGKRHARNLRSMGYAPLVLTQYPDDLDAEFISDYKDLKGRDISTALICTPTALHAESFKTCLEALPGCARYLVEKPVEVSREKADSMISLSQEKNVELFTAYNMRFLSVFEKIREFVDQNRGSIRIVQALAGQDLRQWRPDRKLEDSYSISREKGGGVDLDLSHEVDYCLWLFGSEILNKNLIRRKVSDLPGDAPDICSLTLEYKSCSLFVLLDYIRNPIERYLSISCENGNRLFCDFAKLSLEINGEIQEWGTEFTESYIRMLTAFLEGTSSDILCTAEEGALVLELLGL